MEARLAGRTLAASTEIATAALSADDESEIQHAVVTHAAELLDADLGLLMVTEQDGSLTIAAAAGKTPVNAGDPVGVVLSPRSLAARAARGGVPVVAEDFTTDPRTAPFVPQSLRRYGPFAAAPFGTTARRLGALAVYRRHGRPPFDPASVEVLGTFAAQAAVMQLLAEGAAARRNIAVYQERERLAQDLHDVIVQRLYGTGMQLDLLTRRVAGSLSAAENSRLADIVDELDTTIAEVRATVRALRADPVTPNGADLAESIRQEVRAAGALLGFEPELVITGDTGSVPVGVADHARAAAQEALSNVVRHAGARRLAVELAVTGAGLRLVVRDDGCGIPPGVTRRGLRNLADRAAAAGGSCDISTSADTGTTVTWQVPLHTP